MDEVVFYLGIGDPSDKQSQESYGYITSIHTSKQHASYRQANSSINGTAITGIGSGERIFTAVPNKALIHVYSFGKESIDQKIPIPEALTCLTLVNHPHFHQNNKDVLYKVPNYRTPWLLIGGSKSGKIYIWELNSGNLLCVKDAHYQGVSVIKSSKEGDFLVSGGEDARVLVWNLHELISIYTKGKDDEDSHHVKPYWQITDNTLPITDVILNDVGVLNDLKIYTTSKDSTVRIYDVMTKTLLTTFILPDAVECITKDPANRALYVGLSNGLIRSIPLYQINPHTSVLESIGGLNKIITIEHDPNLKNTFVPHQEQQVSVTTLEISLDGTNIISGDSKGRVFVSDTVTKQVVKSFTPCNSAISFISVDTIPTDFDKTGTLTSKSQKDKQHRMIPQFKRVLTSLNQEEHQLFMDIPATIKTDTEDFESWLNQKKLEELEFKNSFSGINSTVKQVNSNNGNNNTDLEDKLDKVSKAYTELRSKHEELIKEHAKLLSQ
ncbi:IPI3 Pre-rRNA-processing protein IPI3 [Candida maltosa Xu316]